MPIEVQIEKEHGKDLPTAETPAPVPRLCRRASRAPKARLSTLGVLGDWDRPYLTMASRNEADEIRAFGKLLAEWLSLSGLKPVNWCFDCGSALAEAEVEYEDRKDPAVDVGFPYPTPKRIALAQRVRPRIPARQGWLRGDLDDDAVDAAGEPGARRSSRDRLCTRRDGARPCSSSRRTSSRRASRTGSSTPRGRAARGDALERIEFQHPVYDRRAGLPRRLRHARYGHRHRPHCARLRSGRLRVVPALRHEGRPHRDAGRGRRPVRDSLPYFGGLTIWKANPKIVDMLREPGVLLHAETFTTATCTAGATRRRSSTAQRRSGSPALDDAPGYRGVKPGRTLRNHARAESSERSSTRRGAKRGCTGMIANRPDWTLSRQRQWACRCRSSSATPTSCTPTRPPSSTRDARGRGTRSRGVVRESTPGTSASTRSATESSPTRSTCGWTPARHT